MVVGSIPTVGARFGLGTSASAQWEKRAWTSPGRARLAQSVARGSHNPKVVSSILAPRIAIFPMIVMHSGEVAEWSKALRSGRSLFGGVGSNPTLTNFFLGCGNRGLTVRILAFQASGPGSTPGGCSFDTAGAAVQKRVMVMLGLEPRTFALSERRSTD